MRIKLARTSTLYSLYKHSSRAMKITPDADIKHYEEKAFG